MNLTIHPFFEPSSGSYSYVVADPVSRTCAIIDPALGINEAPGDLQNTNPSALANYINTDSADLILDWITAQGFTPRWILETHVHADRPSAGSYLKSKLVCAQTAIGSLTPDVSGFDVLLGEGDKICLGHSCGRVLHTPGHTPGCVAYQFENAVFVGDTLFMPDAGTARCDFPGGSAQTLFSSIRRLLSLPGDTHLYVCHDYGKDKEGNPRRNRFVTTVQEEREENVHFASVAKVSTLHNGIVFDERCEAAFVKMRTRRDGSLATPRWADIAIPANLACMPVAQMDELISRRLRC